MTQRMVRKNTIKGAIAGLGLLALVGMSEGCTGLGAVMQTSNDPAARALGTWMYYEGMHEDRMDEASAGRSEVNVYGNERQEQKQIYTAEIINLDTGKREIEIVGRNFMMTWRYLMNKNEDFAKKGYKIIHKQNGIIDQSYKLNNRKDEETSVIWVENGKGKILWGEDR